MLTIIARVNGQEIRDVADFHWGVRPSDLVFRLRNLGLITVPGDPAWCASLTHEEAWCRVLPRVPQPLPLDRFVPGDNLVIEMCWPPRSGVR